MNRLSYRLLPMLSAIAIMLMLLSQTAPLHGQFREPEEHQHLYGSSQLEDSLSSNYVTSSDAGSLGYRSFNPYTKQKYYPYQFRQDRRSVFVPALSAGLVIEAMDLAGVVSDGTGALNYTPSDVHDYDNYLKKKEMYGNYHPFLFEAEGSNGIPFPIGD